MTSKQYADLELAITRWVDRHCVTNEWPSVVTGNRTVEFMANAARNVFDACEESQEYGAREGLLS